MFYQDYLDQALRFGDVVKGYILTNAIISTPVWNTQHENYKVSVSLPQLSVIMTPCCSIQDGIIVLTPLIQVIPTFFNNPYLEEDLTRVNRIMSPKQSVQPSVWEQFSEEERQRRLAVGHTYAFGNLFVYERHESLPKYTLHIKGKDNIITDYYMIDFRNLHKVHCDKIITPSNSPLESKHLQLSIEAREELRVKLARYYARVPLEDQLIEV